MAGTVKQGRRLSRWDRILAGLIAVLFIVGGVVGFLVSQAPRAALATQSGAPASASPTLSAPGLPGPYAPGKSWQLKGSPDLPAPLGGRAPIAPQVRSVAFDMHGASVGYDPGVVPDPRASAVADTGRRFIIPSAGLNVPLGAVSVAGGSVTPPGFRSVYLIRNMGVPLENAASGTVYAATHALRNGTAPGNYVIDVQHRTTSLHNGAAIIAGGLTYHVTGSQVISKPALAAPRDIWRNRPGRLVLITCLQLAPNQPAVQNLVITAQL